MSLTADELRQLLDGYFAWRDRRAAAKHRPLVRRVLRIEHRLLDEVGVPALLAYLQSLGINLP